MIKDENKKDDSLNNNQDERGIRQGIKSGKQDSHNETK